MARTGDRFEMVDGSVYAVTRSSTDTGGEFVDMEFTLPPGSVSPPPHVHTDLVEEYEVIEGPFEVMVEGEWRKLEPGDSASVPKGALHTFKNRSDRVVRVRNVHRPAARFEDYIEHMHRLLEARGISSGKDPRVPLYISLVMLEYPETLAPGRARERIPIKAMAALGKLFRLRTEP